MIKFRYALKEDINALLITSVADYDGTGYLVGFMEDYHINQISNLRHCSLYLTCEEIETEDNKVINKSPIAIVAKNESAAINIYNKLTNKPATVLCELERSCYNLKVETV